MTNIDLLTDTGFFVIGCIILITRPDTMNFNLALWANNPIDPLTYLVDAGTSASQQEYCNSFGTPRYIRTYVYDFWPRVCTLAACDKECLKELQRIGRGFRVAKSCEGTLCVCCIHK
ncbi:hypothetical protein QVD17_20975 [Tagetes erecta]|uniref:Uncharacterized protein n=1 Tax=Tagetes erecta TaxID=13708 RepID=A0AAD8KQX7_TARER|nr:hypothetical protein QVD17_20975 [Tagetes erecta]